MISLISANFLFSPLPTSHPPSLCCCSSVQASTSPQVLFFFSPLLLFYSTLYASDTSVLSLALFQMAMNVVLLTPSRSPTTPRSSAYRHLTPSPEKCAPFTSLFVSPKKPTASPTF